MARARGRGSSRGGQASSRSGGGSSSGGSGRGFAAMDEDERREISRRGGEASARAQERDERGRFGGS